MGNNVNNHLNRGISRLGYSNSIIYPFSQENVTRSILIQSFHLYDLHLPKGRVIFMVNYLPKARRGKLKLLNKTNCTTTIYIKISKNKIKKFLAAERHLSLRTIESKQALVNSMKDKIWEMIQPWTFYWKKTLEKKRNHISSKVNRNNR